MTPYVQLQEIVIQVLRGLLKEGQTEYLKELLAWSRNEENSEGLRPEDLTRFNEINPSFPGSQGLIHPEEWGWIKKTSAEILVQQLDDASEPFTVRNLLGTPLFFTSPLDYAGYIDGLGSGNNRLRKNSRFAQPAALLKGDILANGDRVLSEPREGGNGSVLVHLTGGWYGHWIDVPARMPIALLHPDDGAPPELVGDWQPHEG